MLKIVLLIGIMLQPAFGMSLFPDDFFLSNEEIEVKNIKSLLEDNKKMVCDYNEKITHNLSRIYEQSNYFFSESDNIIKIYENTELSPKKKANQSSGSISNLKALVGAMQIEYSFYRQMKYKMDLKWNDFDNELQSVSYDASEQIISETFRSAREYAICYSQFNEKFESFSWEFNSVSKRKDKTNLRILELK